MSVRVFIISVLQALSRVENWNQCHCFIRGNRSHDHNMLLRRELSELILGLLFAALMVSRTLQQTIPGEWTEWIGVNTCTMMRGGEGKGVRVRKVTRGIGSLLFSYFCLYPEGVVACSWFKCFFRGLCCIESAIMHIYYHFYILSIAIFLNSCIPLLPNCSIVCKVIKN